MDRKKGKFFILHSFRFLPGVYSHAFYLVKTNNAIMAMVDFINDHNYYGFSFSNFHLISVLPS